MEASNKHLVERYKTLKTNRRLEEQTWQDIADLMLPYSSMFTGIDVPGERRTDEIYDSTAPLAAERAAAGLYTRATNPSTRWFHLRPQDPKLMEVHENRIWLEDARDKMQATISSELSSAFYQMYLSLVTLGNGCLFIDEHDERIISGAVFPLSQVVWEENSAGLVDRVYRMFPLTARQAVEKWGDKCSAAIKKAVKDDSNKVFKFLHVVTPRDNRKPGAIDTLNKPFSSKWMEIKTGNALDEGGFDEMPYACPRLSTIAGELYGRGSGHTALPAVESVNEYRRLMLDAANMSVRPAYDVPLDTYTTPLRLTPAALNYNQDPSGRKATPLSAVGDIRITANEMQELKREIKEIFFNDQLQLNPGGPEKTAFQVQAELQQMLLMMGPWAGRLQREFHNVVVDRVFAIMFRKNLFMEDIPADLEEDPVIKTVYDSPLSRAQKQSDVQAIDQAVQFTLPFAQAGLPIMDNFDLDKMTRRRAEILGLPSDLELDEEERDAQRQAQAQAAAQQQQLQQAQQLAETAKTASEVQQ